MPKRIKKVTKEDLKNTRAGKYLIARTKTKTKKEALELAGINPSAQSTIENSPTYKALEEKYFKGAMLEEISIQQIAKELTKNITQDEDRGAKNKAIEIALNRIEPDKITEKDDEQVIVILKGE